MSSIASEYCVLASSAMGRKRGVALLLRKDIKILSEGVDENGFNFKLTDARTVAERIDGPRFTLAQFRQGRFTWSRIDRVYVSDCRVLRVSHHSKFWTSDLIPLTVSFTLDKNFQPNSNWHHSGYFKADPYVVEQNLEYLKEVWEELKVKHSSKPPTELFLRCWMGLRKEIKGLQYKKKQSSLQVPLKEARIQELLSVGYGRLTPEEEVELAVLMDEVRELQAWQHHWWRLTCRDKLLREGDACTCYFFKKFKRRKVKTFIQKLKTEDGKVLQDQNQIAKVAQENFMTLYAAHETTQGEREKRDRLLADTNQRLSTE
ncbi:hypothetical protein R1sor_010074 [Riccia sorocarpa]|uniref:Uncharacterized protein n=1 Tax=Riccia sorocarpa TaxID=122646 RepID=A0ABD3HX23_9MARC